MIVIYTQDKTYIRNNAAAARNILLDIYGRNSARKHTMR